MINVPLLYSALIRKCTYANVNEEFIKFAEKYELSESEKIEVIQLLKDMKYPINGDV